MLLPIRGLHDRGDSRALRLAQQCKHFVLFGRRSCLRSGGIGRGGGFDWVGTVLLTGRFFVRDNLHEVLADFDFDLLVAIWPSSGSTTASCAATDTAPPIGKAGRKRRGNAGLLFAREAIQQRGSVLQATSFINQLFDFHGDRHAFGNASRQRACLGRLLRCALPRSVWNEFPS